MNLANDYFLLYHGSQVKKEISYEIMNIKEAEFYEVAALILSATRKNYEKYFPLKSFNKLCKIITDKTPTTINELYQLQYNLIEIISKNNNKDDIEKLHSTFEYLKNENILNNADNEKLISLFDPSELVVEEEKTNDVAIDNNLTFQEHKEDIDDTIKQLKELFNKEELKKS